MRHNLYKQHKAKSFTEVVENPSTCRYVRHATTSVETVTTMMRQLHVSGKLLYQKSNEITTA